MNLPDHLSAEAAMALFDFVCELESAIWNKYEPLLIPLYMDELRRESLPGNLDVNTDPLEDFDDQLPLF